MLVLCLELPPSPIANEFVSKQSQDQELIPLDLVMCKVCRHVQSRVIVDPKSLFGDYLYESGTSPTTLQHLREEAKTINETLGLSKKEKSFVLEIGSNDGSFLSMFKEIGMPAAHLIGVDPSETMARKARGKHDIETFVEFFTKSFASTVKEMLLPPDVVVANNVLAHVPDIRDVLEGIKLLIGDTGVLVLEVAHVVDIFDGGAFDTIYHEHTSHHALGPLMSALEDVGLPVFDAERQEKQVGRGSLRVWAAHPDARVSWEDSRQRIKDILELEEKLGVEEPEAWENLKFWIEGQGKRVRLAMSELTGMKVWGYGAPAKLTTLTYAYRMGVGSFAPLGLFINAIAEDSPFKQGLFTPGTHIPIRTPEELIAAQPSAVIVFAWNFFDQISVSLRKAGFMGSIFNIQDMVART